MPSVRGKKIERKEPGQVYLSEGEYPTKDAGLPSWDG